MRTKMLLVCAGLLLTGVSAGAQKKDLGRIPARTVTLVSYFRQKDYGKSVFDFERGVRAVAGHMYVLHVKEERADYYAMFRVESLGAAGECNLSWKRVPSPER
jgi:hypothetical protein